MGELFASGRIIDIVLALVAIEVAALPWILKRLGSPVALKSLLPNIAAGAALMLALRFSLTGFAWPWIAGAMSAALAAHLYDLRQRLQAG